MGMRKLSDWDRFDGLASGVLPEEYLGKFVTGETCLIVVGKPVLSMNTSLGDLVIVGSGQQIAVQQQKQTQFVWEMGSRRGTIVPGRTMASLTISKMQVHGPSLLKSLYAHMTADELAAIREKAGPDGSEFWLNLASDVFDMPTGIGLMMRDLQNKQYSSFFFEDVYVGGHQFATGATTIVMGESVQCKTEAILPLPMAGLVDV